MEFKMPFSGRAHDYTQEEINAVVNAMKTADPLTQGKILKEFEDKFCRFSGSRYAFAVSNATAALEMAAQLCNFQKGDEVVIPSHTFTSSAYPFIKKGARIVWADIDLKTRVVTARTVSERITPKTKAIVVVHLYGYGANMSEIMEVAGRHKLRVVEDAAQALGVKVDGKQAGTFGNFGIFSFHSHKNISTLGEGGMLTLNDERCASLIPMLRHNGHCSFPFEREDYWIPAMGNVDLPESIGGFLWPNNFCLGEVECALGIQMLDRIASINQEKQERAIRFMDGLDDFQELEFHRDDSGRHNYHLLVARLVKGDRDVFIRKMAEEKGVQCIVQYYPLNRYPMYQKAGFAKAHCPNADLFFDTMISFPFHHRLADSDLNYMLESARDVLGEMR